MWCSVAVISVPAGMQMEWLAWPTNAQAMRMRASFARVEACDVSLCVFGEARPRLLDLREVLSFCKPGFGLAGPSSGAYRATLCACICSSRGACEVQLEALQKLFQGSLAWFGDASVLYRGTCDADQVGTMALRCARDQTLAQPIEAPREPAGQGDT